MNDILQELLPLIEALARSIARSYPGVEQDDMYQALCLFVLQHGQDLDPANEASCRYVLTKAAHVYAGEQRAEALGNTAQYNYRPDDVRRILETGSLDDDREQWVHVHVPHDARSLKGNAALEVTLDVRRALDELAYVHYEAIHSRYVLGEVPLAGSAGRKALDRAVERLVETLNGYSDERLRMHLDGYVGSRRAIGNAQALAKIREAY